MQSRHNVTGIQYEGGVSFDYKNTALLAQSLVGNIFPGVCLFVSVGIESVCCLHWPKCQSPVFLFMSNDISSVCHHSLGICADLSLVNASMCPLQAPIRHVLTHSEDSGGGGVGVWGSHLLLNFGEGWEISLRTFPPTAVRLFG